MIFAATFVASCAACFAAVSLLALFSDQVDTALDYFVTNIIEPCFCSSRTSLPRSSQLRFPFLVFVLFSSALVSKGNICRHGLDSPMFWFWVSGKQRRRSLHDVDASLSQHVRSDGVFHTFKQPVESDEPVPIDLQEAKEFTIGRGIAENEPSECRLHEITARTILPSAESEAPQTFRRMRQGSRQRMMQRRFQETVKSFHSHKKQMKKFFRTIYI